MNENKSKGNGGGESVGGTQTDGVESVAITIAAIAETASHEMVAAMVNSSGDVAKIRSACENDPYWPAFCDAVQVGKVPENWLPGGIGRSVIGWAKQGVQQ